LWPKAPPRARGAPLLALKSRRVNARIALAGLLAILAGCGGSTAPPAPSPVPPPAAAAGRPSFVVVVSDDLDVRLFEHLPWLGDEFRKGGVSFPRAYVTTALCAPSRASILTGRYAHNHGVLKTAPPHGGIETFVASGLESETVAAHLKRAGYRTGFVGKYVNGYPRGVAENYRPPGWDFFVAPLEALRPERYWGYWLNDDGERVEFGDADGHYLDDVLAERALRFLRQATAGSDPFLLVVMPYAPHFPMLAPSRHASRWFDERVMQSPSFNEADVRDKPIWVQANPRLSPAEEDRVLRQQRLRFTSMLATEDLLRDALAVLQRAGRADDTYLMFSSDNGILMGEHRLTLRKANNYEEAIRVPLVIRGPGVARGVERPHFALNVDLAPTMLDLAGLAVPDSMDGRSLAPLLKPGGEATPWRQDVMVEYFSGPGGRSSALRTDGWLYHEAESGERELYDMRADPYQMHSLHEEGSSELMKELSERLRRRRDCRGAACRE
jgi:N-acetylglucosamine-6-sulfatase